MAEIDLAQFLWLIPVAAAASPLILTAGTIAANEWLRLSEEERRGLIWGTAGSIIASSIVTAVTTLLAKS